MLLHLFLALKQHMGGHLMLDKVQPNPWRAEEEEEEEEEEYFLH
jgi:hypothetical protein